MKVVIDIPDAPIADYQDLFSKIYGMAASEGLFDDKVKSQRALALKVVLEVLDGVVNGTPLPKGHGRLIDISKIDKDRRESCNPIIYLTIDGQYTEAISLDYLNDLPTIIEEDKSESEDDA